MKRDCLRCGTKWELTTDRYTWIRKYCGGCSGTNQAARYGGNREKVIQRDGERCVGCRMTRQEHRDKWGKDITVDHIDGKGYYTPIGEKNNDMDNLQTLCLRCHNFKDKAYLNLTKSRMIVSSSRVR